MPVAEYRPDSRSLVYRVDPVTLSAERVFQFEDHLGALVCDRAGRRLVGVSWGSRRLYRWELLPDRDVPRDPTAPVETRNHRSRRGGLIVPIRLMPVARTTA